MQGHHKAHYMHTKDLTPPTMWQRGQPSYCCTVIPLLMRGRANRIALPTRELGWLTEQGRWLLTNLTAIMGLFSINTYPPLHHTVHRGRCIQKLQSGHTGRHKFSHVKGHPFLRSLPPSIEEIVDRNLDGTSDTFKAYYDGASMGLREQLPIGTIMDVHRQYTSEAHWALKHRQHRPKWLKTAWLRLTQSQRNIIAIGGSGFSPIAFLLKGHASLGEDGTSTQLQSHLAPKTNALRCYPCQSLALTTAFHSLRFITTRLI